MRNGNTNFFAALTRELPKPGASPFFIGIGLVGCVVVYATANATEADKKASKFINPGGAH
jgi:hypothetical protein